MVPIPTPFTVLPPAALSLRTLDRVSTYFTLISQSKTFACNFDGRPSGLVLDLRNGFALYDVPSKVPTFHFCFFDLNGSHFDSATTGSTNSPN